MNPEIKEKIKKVMTDYLTKLGWPNMPDPDRFAFGQAENMFKILLSLNLVKYADWEPYYMAAMQQYERSQLRKQGYNV